MSDLSELDIVMGWSGPVLPLGRWAGDLDRRRFNNVSWPTLPLTLADNHQGTAFVGPIDNMEVLTVDEIGERVTLSDQDREEIGESALWASGRFSPTEEGFKAAAQLAFWGRLPTSAEVRDGDYTEVPIEDDDGMILGAEMDWSRTVVGAVALERLPAFAGAWIRPDPVAAQFVPSEDAPMDDDEDADEVDEIEDEMLSAESVDSARVLALADYTRQASAAVHSYPTRMFSRLDYREPTRLSISADGEVTGHVAVWGRRYRQSGGGNWVATRSGDLSEWLVGNANLDDGTSVRTGVVVSDSMHQWGPSTRADMRRQVEDTSLQVMQVYAWEDAHGIAVHGSLLPGVTVEQATRAMAGCPSIVTMDQRDGRGQLPCAVLCVNMCGLKPGDAVVRMNSGEPEMRVLAASAAPESCGCGGTCGGCGSDITGDTVNGLPPYGQSSDLLEWTAQASADEPPPPPNVVEVGKLKDADEEWRKVRLKAAVAPRPKG